MNRPFNPIALHRLLKHGSKADILKIPRHRFDLEQIYENGDTVYHVVLRNKELKEEEITKIFQMFLDRGVDPATLNDYSKAPLHLAIEYRMKYVVIFLIQHSRRLLDSPYVLTGYFIRDESVKFRDGAKRNCGHLKSWNSENVESASASFFEWLILKELDPDPESNREIRLDLLNSSIENNLQHITLTFLRLAPVKLIKTAHPEVLALFCVFFQTIVRARMRHNNWSSKDWYSSYSSRYASKIVKIFLENGATVDDSWRKDIYWAIRQKEDISVIKLLVDHFSDNSVKRDFAKNCFKAILEYPCTDLSHLEIRCYKQVLRDLVKKAAEVKYDYARCLEGESPLQLAVKAQNLPAAAFLMLLSRGAQVNALYRALYAAKNRTRSRYSFVNYTRNYSDRFQYCRDDVKTLVKQHCLKLVAAGLLVTENRTPPLQVTIDHQFYQECLKELETLKRTFINSCTSLYHFLHMNLDRKSLYAKNEELNKLVNPAKLEKKFPQYSSLILAGYRAGKTRNCVLERAKEAWLELTEIYLPDICIERILFYLSNEELAKVIARPQKRHNCNIKF